jgi:NADH-quinone oxidoreductase subunit N
MNRADIIALSPFIVITATSVVLMISIAFYRNHKLTAGFTLTGLALATWSLTRVIYLSPRQVTHLFLVDPYALFFMGLIFLSAFAVAALS